jgi:probable phosphoglycerate mutase
MGLPGVVAMSPRLWLVRHGPTDWSDAGRLNGWTDVPLNDRGRLQARFLAKRLEDVGFAGVWSSDLTRGEETARLALREPVIDPRLRELDFGALEGKRWEEISPEMHRGLAAFEGFAAPGGESVADLRSRVFRFVEALPEGDHVVFTHGGVIRLLLRQTGADRRVLPGEVVQVVLGCARHCVREGGG